jgi:hypothetical protein
MRQYSNVISYSAFLQVVPISHVSTILRELQMHCCSMAAVCVLHQCVCAWSNSWFHQWTQVEFHLSYIDQHSAANGFIAAALKSPNLRCPASSSRAASIITDDERRPDCVMAMHWQSGRCLYLGCNLPKHCGWPLSREGLLGARSCSSDAEIMK